MSRIIATAGTIAVLLTYVCAAAFDERPQLMFVGLWPLSHVGAETAWYLLGDLFGDKT